MRQQKITEQFIELLANCTSKKQTAESAAAFLKTHFRLRACTVLLSEQLHASSYGDALPRSAELAIPKQGEELKLPEAALAQGWLTLEMKTANGRVGWLLYKSGRRIRKHSLHSCVFLLTLALQALAGYQRITETTELYRTDLEAATLQLKHTNEKLKSLDETKDEFISMASHQLRTPLTSVKGYLSMVLEGDAGELNEQQHKLLTQAFISSQRMVYLIADLLNVSRLRTGKFLIETEPTYLPDVVEGELNQLRETAEAKGLKLHFDKPSEFPTLKLDETKIRQVVMNFVDNAIYYTPAGGEITVSLEATPRKVEFKVADTGLGVPKADQHKLFAKFYRADNAKRARPDGTGLGLYMARKVIAAQGGAIIFKSVEGKGSTFGFTFPRAKLETEDQKAV